MGTRDCEYSPSMVYLVSLEAHLRYHPDIKPPHRKLSDLIGTPLQQAQYLHVSPPFSSEDVWALQQEIAKLTSDKVEGAWAPRLVFEPTPPSCHVGQRIWLEKVSPGLHVLSPNHEELLSFYGHPKTSTADPLLVETLENVMLHLLHTIGIGKEGKGILAVRCGRLGSCIGTRSGGLKWFPAYFSGDEECRVKDVTGGEKSGV
jgi:sugar/nucleoside kinase (ribokinase family)